MRPSAETLEKAERQRDEIHERKDRDRESTEGLSGELHDQAKAAGREAKPDPKPGQKPAKEAPAEKPKATRRKKGDKLSAKAAAVEILTKAGGPMLLSELTEQILAHPKTKVGGKTPGATIAAMFYVEAKKSGGLFRKTGAKKPTFALR